MCARPASPKVMSSSGEARRRRCSRVSIVLSSLRDFDARQKIVIIANRRVATGIAEEMIDAGVDRDQKIVPRTAMKRADALSVVGVESVVAAFAEELIVAVLPVEPVALCAAIDSVASPAAVE